MVEQSFAPLHWFRRLRIRWDIRDDIHEAFLSLACGIICRRRLQNLSLRQEFQARVDTMRPPVAASGMGASARSRPAREVQLPARSMATLTWVGRVDGDLGSDIRVSRRS
ncbi:hypothetical protein [Streptomyces mirabilis]|uniref:hypothetical protein n=1 Tax=Streptomyces mirabilis TaxID=68239 RepID=UPI0036A0DA4E